MKILSTDDTAMADVILELIDQRIAGLRAALDAHQEHPEKIEGLAVRLSEMVTAKTSLQTAVDEYRQKRS